MGGNYSYLKQETLDELSDCTFFTKSEVVNIHKKWIELCQKVGKWGPGNNESVVLTQSEIIDNFSSISYNPFRFRITKVFSQHNDGNMAFEDFLEFLSVFSSSASREVKQAYAFRIYDMDSDGFLDRGDLVEVVDFLCGKDTLSKEEKEYAVQQILAECDLDGDERLSYTEFESIVARSPNFTNTFRIRM